MLNCRRPPFRPYRLTVRTRPFHGRNRGSIPRGVTKVCPPLQCGGQTFVTPTQRWRPTVASGNRKPERCRAPREAARRGRDLRARRPEATCDRFPVGRTAARILELGRRLKNPDAARTLVTHIALLAFWIVRTRVPNTGIVLAPAFFTNLCRRPVTSGRIC